MSDMRELVWCPETVTFKAMLMEEINKNIWLWLIDSENTVRAFDYDARLWDTSKQFNLGTDFKSFQMMPMGYFLIALRPQYQSSTALTAADHNDDDEKDDQKEPESARIRTGRIELHSFFLMEQKKLEYVVHKSSTTGYETGNEREYKA